MSSSSRLSGQSALVTGVTSGIGAATVRALLAQGMRVSGIGRDEARLHAAASELGANFEPFCVDLAQPEARRAAFVELSERARARPFQLLVNNAAECVYDAPLELEAGRLSRLFEINVTAALELCQALAPSLRPGAQIINLSSVVARHLPAAKFAPYAATKAALDCLSEALRLQLHSRGIAVSTLSPGLVDTPIYDKVEGFERARAQLRERVPTWLSAEDVAETIVWMATRPAHCVVSELSLLPVAQAR